MDLSTDRIPNKMLLGSEVLEIAVNEFREMMRRDHYFSPGIAYRKVAFTLQGTFHFGYPLPPDVVIKSRMVAGENGVIQGEVPLKDIPEDESSLLALERDVIIDNPNIARVQNDIPITIQERVPPRAETVQNLIPGEPPQFNSPYPQVVTHKLKYDKKDYPKGPESVDRDVSESAAAKLGVKTRTKS